MRAEREVIGDGEERSIKKLESFKVSNLILGGCWGGRWEGMEREGWEVEED